MFKLVCCRFLFIHITGLLFYGSATCLAYAEEIAVITHPSVSSASANRLQVTRLFSIRQTVWQNEQPVVVFVLPNDSPLHRQFSINVLGVFPYQLDRIWNKLAFSGLGEKPIQVNSEQEMIKRVGTTPGAIGYVSSVNVLSNVNVLAVREQ